MTHTERLEGDTGGDTLEDSSCARKWREGFQTNKKQTKNTQIGETHSVTWTGGIAEYITILSEDSHTLITSSDIAERPFGPKVSH